MQTFIQKIFGIGGCFGFAILLLGAGWQTYVLEFRPVVSAHVPEFPSRNWMCGRAISARHCVVISMGERSVWDYFILSLPLCIMLVGGGILLSRSEHVR